MKKRQFKHVGKALLLCSAMLPLAACIDGYGDDKTWESTTQNATMTTPAAGDIRITESSDGSELIVTWPVVFGAGGYDFTLTNVTDPDNPVVVLDKIVDGCSVRCPAEEDSKYEVSLRTLGNPKFNNADAPESETRLVPYTNMLEVTAAIPTGTNLTQYFTDHPISADPSTQAELCYELDANGTYTMDGNILPGMRAVTFRGNRVNHAKLTMTNGSFVNSGATLRLKYIDIACASFEGAQIIQMNPTFNEADSPLSGGGYLFVPTISVQSCKITGLTKRFFHNDAQKYAIGSFLIKDCIIGQNTTANQQVIYVQGSGGPIKDLTLQNSTFYNEQINSGYFIQCQGVKVGDVGTLPTGETWANANLKITNCTFWQCVKNDQMGNYANNFAQKGNNITVQSCIFVDCGGGQVTRRLGGGIANATFTCGLNSYWFNGTFTVDEINPDKPNESRDRSGTVIQTNPNLKDPANGDFTPQGAEQIEKKTGDPRWLDDNIWK